MKSNGKIEEKRVRSRGSLGSERKWRGITSLRGGMSKMSEDEVVMKPWEIEQPLS